MNKGLGSPTGGHFAERAMVVLALAWVPARLATAQPQPESCQNWLDKSPQPTTSTTQQVAAMAYDAARGVTVLFGGHTGATWEWDGTLWTYRPETGPTANSAAMAFDMARSVTV